MCVRLLFNFSAFVSVALSWAVTVAKEKGAAIAGTVLSFVRPNEPLGDFVICRRTLMPPPSGSGFGSDEARNCIFHLKLNLLF